MATSDRHGPLLREWPLAQLDRLGCPATPPWVSCRRNSADPLHGTGPDLDVLPATPLAPSTVFPCHALSSRHHSYRQLGVLELSGTRPRSTAAGRSISVPSPPTTVVSELESGNWKMEIGNRKLRGQPET